VEKSGRITHQKVVSLESQQASKVILQPANKGALYCLPPRTKKCTVCCPEPADPWAR
jgi:hypothetical protein